MQQKSCICKKITNRPTNQKRASNLGDIFKAQGLLVRASEKRSNDCIFQNTGQYVRTSQQKHLLYFFDLTPESSKYCIFSLFPQKPAPPKYV